MKSLLSAPVLVLNANFEPLNVCTTRRAIGLMYNDKAMLVQNGRGYIQSVSNKFQAPSVIRLSNMIKRPRPIVKLSKAEIFRRDNYICQYCGKKTTNLTIDHVIPRSKGGEHAWENLVAACPGCNHKKGGRTAHQANMDLLKQPKAPSATALYIFGRYLQQYEEWIPYVTGW
jgi:5-methylcytosine-specific restriction endonuclease McrA